MKSTTLQRIVSAVLLVVWGAWWCVGLYQKKLFGSQYKWIPFGFLGCDFVNGGYRPARMWLEGKDVYAEREKLCFIYPPPVLKMFAWCGLFSEDAAIVVQVCILGSIAAVGAWLAWRTRKKLGLCDLTLSTVLALVLFSMPVLYGMESGNCDSLSIIFIIVGITIWRWNSPVSQFAAGAVLALAPWLKVYPGLLGVGCVGLRRWYALAGFIVGGLVIGALHAEDVPKFIRNNCHITEVFRQLQMADRVNIDPWNHSLTQLWPKIWVKTPFKFLSRINGFVAAFVILGSSLGWVTYHVYKCPESDRFAFPYLMWIMALASFVPPNANDYSLVFLPIAAVAVWDRKDPFYVQIAMLALLVWWQPVGLPVNGRLILVFKVCGLIAVGISLVRRVKEFSGRGHVPEVDRVIAG